MASATFYKPPNATTNGDFASPQHMTTNGMARAASSRRQPIMDYENETEDVPRAPEAPRVRSVSYRNHPAAVSGNRETRSFFARTKNLPPDWDLKADGDPATPQAHDFDDENYDPNRYPTDPSIKSVPHQPVPNPVAPGEDLQTASSPMGSGSQASPLSRSNTVRSAKEQRHDWANDRSPLQKLEVTLGSISKEEKRARVLEAEMRLKQRLARQQIESNKRESAQPEPQEAPSIADGKTKSTTPERTVPNQTLSHSQPKPDTLENGVSQEARRPEHRRFASDGREARGFQGQRQAEKPPSAHGRLPPPNLQYAAVNVVKQPQFSPAQGQFPPNTNMGRDPKRPMTAGKDRSEAYIRTADPTNRNTFRGFPPSNMAGFQGPPVPGPPEMAARGEMNTRALPKQPPQQPMFANRRVGPMQQTGRGAEPYTRAVNIQQHGPNVLPPGHISGPNFTPMGLELNQDMGAEDHRIALQNAQDGFAPQSKPKKQSVSFDVPPPTPPPLFEWRNAPIAKLEASDFDFQNFDMDRSKAWWEGGGSADRRQSRALPKTYRKPIPKTKESNKAFQPPLFLKCGPLLRYTGMRRERIDGPNGPVERDTWRGSIMIVTQSSRSTYDPAPTLRLFSQPMDLLPPPPAKVDGAQLAPEYVDPTAGLMKMGRDGRPLYVKPVDHLDEEEDLSLIENDDGIYEQTPSIVDYSSDATKQPIPANRIHPTDGETAGAYKEISGIRLYADPDRDVTFWRFNLEVELGPTQQRIAYRINQGPAVGFWVPAKGQAMNIMFHTSNGFSLSVDSNKVCGPDPLWRDMLNEHQTRPFHVMIGGGDQIFNDSVIVESTLFQEWIKTKNSNEKYNAPFSAEFKAQLESFYLERYSTWFSQGLFALANSHIPMVNMWNDHEIIEGYGSYGDEFMRSPVISGLGKVAFKYYLLFQHHTVPEETDAEEPSWLLGAEPGPYIREKSRNMFMSLGGNVSFLALDCRTERMNNEILSEQTCDLIWDRCHREIVKGETKHLIVLLSIPIAYPRVAMIKNLLNSRKSLGKAGMFGGLLNKHGGSVEIFDDHWTAKHHKSERTWLIEDLQDLAAEKSVRVTILSGDVHLAAIGQFYSNPKLNVAKDKDYRYMPNVVSSAIADMPETEMISDMLNRRNRVHHMDSNTDEDMIPIFTHDVDGKSRNNKRLLPRRNWCSIREYQPGTTPLTTPESEVVRPATEPRPGKLQRTLSLTRGDRAGGGLLRRLSLRGPPPTKDFSLVVNANQRRMSMDGPFPPTETAESYFPQPAQAEFRPGPFHRRPTNLSQKAAKQGDDGVGAFVNLEGGLAITLNLEVNPRDPSGITTSYKLLVPTLRFEGDEYDPPATQITKGWKKWLGMRRKEKSYPDQGGMSDDEDDYGDEAEDEGYPRSDEEFPTEAQVPVGQPAPDQGDAKRPKKKWFGVI